MNDFVIKLEVFIGHSRKLKQDKERLRDSVCLKG